MNHVRRACGCDFESVTATDTAVLGIYSTVRRAERTVDALVRNGFLNADIVVMCSDHENWRHPGHQQRPKAIAGSRVARIGQALVAIGMPEYEARWYERRVNNGAVLVAVLCRAPQQIIRAKDTLARTGADDIVSGEQEPVGATERDEKTG